VLTGRNFTVQCEIHWDLRTGRNLSASWVESRSESEEEQGRYVEKALWYRGYLCHGLYV
jgi:hypothetical protein